MPFVTMTGHLAADQIGRHCRQPIVLVVRPAILDSHVLALDETGFAQALPERTDEVRGGGSRGGPEKPDHRQRRLRARGEGPSDCGAAQHSEKFAPSHLPSPAQERAS